MNHLIARLRGPQRTHERIADLDKLASQLLDLTGAHCRQLLANGLNTDQARVQSLRFAAGYASQVASSAPHLPDQLRSHVDNVIAEWSPLAEIKLSEFQERAIVARQLFNSRAQAGLAESQNAAAYLQLLADAEIEAIAGCELFDCSEVETGERFLETADGEYRRPLLSAEEKRDYAESLIGLRRYLRSKNRRFVGEHQRTSSFSTATVLGESEQAAAAPIPNGNLRKSRPGPKPDFANQRAVKEIVDRIAPSGFLIEKLDEVCEALDDAQPPVPVPPTWKDREPPIRNWTGATALTGDRDLAVKAIKYRLSRARRDN